MSTQRIDQLPENTFWRTLSDLETAFNALKSAPQYVAGSNVTFRTSDTGAAYDWSGTLPPAQAVGIGTKILRVTATAQTSANLFGDLIPKLFVGTSSNWYRPSNMLADIKAGHTSFSTAVTDDIVDLSHQNAKQWIVSITGDRTTTCYFKPYIVASDVVTISVVAVN